MRLAGQFCLLATLVCSGYAGFVYLVYHSRQHRVLRRFATFSGLAAWLALSGVVVALAYGLLTRDFSFDYVARYSSRLLSWQYALSALWVGQAGSLLLWAWILAGLSILFRFLPSADSTLRDFAFGLLMLFLSFLAGLMVFTADPCQANLIVRQEGLGLSPILQHPSMLIHPPVVFFAYAAWTIPFALASAALIHNRLDTAWLQLARPWALLAWSVLGVGVLLGAHWAYQELGWGGYWGWDPVENGSLLPWLTGTAFIHCLMAWRHRNCLKKTAVALAILTFGLCNFATFLTRSGIFSSVHAFSESPIGWMFLALMAVLLAGGAGLVFLRRQELAPQRVAKSLLARETLVLVSTSLFLLLTLIVLTSTLVGPISTMLGQAIQVSPSFYDQALVPIGLLLVAITSAVPLLRWGEGPGQAQRRILLLCLAAGGGAVVVAYCVGSRGFLPLSVTGFATVAVASFLGTILFDARRRRPHSKWRGLLVALRDGRPQYMGYVVHLGFIALALGVTGSALGSRRLELDMSEGDMVNWGGRQIRYVQLDQSALPDKLIAEAVLEIASDGASPVTLRPARHLHLLQNEWTTEVAIHSTWGGDFYTILNAGLGDGKVALTFVDNPMICWIWLGGLAMSLGALAAIPPVRKRPGVSKPENKQQHDSPGQESVKLAA
ncbi:MAG: cytochrome c-type biogenesis CcmF C-terminal domain-containing protein [Gemmataceae bacterium]